MTFTQNSLKGTFVEIAFTKTQIGESAPNDDCAFLGSAPQMDARCCSDAPTEQPSAAPSENMLPQLPSSN